MELRLRQLTLSTFTPSILIPFYILEYIIRLDFELIESFQLYSNPTTNIKQNLKRRPIATRDEIRRIGFYSGEVLRE
jgi:hypothetical protein